MAVVDGMGMGSGGEGSDDAFAATGEEVSIADFSEGFMVVGVDGCEGSDCDGR